MAEVDLFFGISNSQERIHPPCTSDPKWSSAHQESTDTFLADKRSLSQILQPSQVQNKSGRKLQRTFTVPYIKDISFDDFSTNSMENFSLSQALQTSQKRQIESTHSRNDMKRKKSLNDDPFFIHSELKTNTKVSGGSFECYAVPSDHLNISNKNVPSNIEQNFNKDKKRNTNDLQDLFQSSENNANLNFTNRNYAQAYNSSEHGRSTSENSVCFSQELTDSLSTPAQLCFTGRKNIQHKLRSVDEIFRFREVFDFPYFNMIQSMVFDEVFYTDKPMVVSAPTGAGKTVIFELAIIRLLIKLKNSRNNWKIVYMAPMKALCSEKYQEWKGKFSVHGLNLMELTGDTELEDFSELHQVNFILTTPEKWDSMSRKWKDNKSLFQMIQLFLIDEIHILNDTNRGATVEAVVSRMKILHTTDRSADRSMRFIAVSATIPNTEDIANWLGSNVRPAVHFKVDEKYRPVHLQKVVIGYPCKEGFSEFRFDMNLSYKLKGIIDAYSDNKPVLVFCSSRKSVQYTAETLKKEHFGKSFLKAQHREHVQKISRTLNDSRVSELLYLGIGIHHAGMAVHDRNIVENTFREGELPVLIATSTLAMGVNLPAHLVVIKSTMFYNMGVPTEYSDTQVLQMIGRAGRPQFDKSATAVIMTKSSTKSKYESLMNGTQLIESSLHRNLIEHLNAEVVLHTITDVALAVEWIRHTFLYVRVMKNPGHYGYPKGLDWKQIEKKLEDLCLQNLNLLAGLNLVNLNEENFEVIPTDTGKLMARYCIAFETMKNFHSIETDSSIKDMIDIIAGCREFEDITLRNNEKCVLNTLNKDKHRENIRYPMSGKIKTKQMKVNCLIQAQLGCLPIQDFSLSQDVNKIFRIGQRITKCLMEFLWQKKDYISLLTAVQLYKSMKTKLWDNSKYVTKQLDGIGPTMSLALVNAGLTTFHTLEESNPREIELIVNRHPPFGNQIRDAVAALPKYEMAIEQLKNYKAQTAEIVININLLNKEVMMDYKNGKVDHQSVLLIGDQDNSIVFKWRILDLSIVHDDGWRRRIEVKRALGGPNLHVHLLSLEYMGLDIHTDYIPVYHGKFCRDPDDTVIQENILKNAPSKGTLQKRSCQHKCLNKSLCAHKCCKQGISSLPKMPSGTYHESKVTNQTATTKEKKGVEAQITLLKDKMLQLNDALPDSKKQNVKDLRLSTPVINLNQFAYCKPSSVKQRMSLSSNNDSSPVKPDPLNCNQKVNSTGWTQLDMYQRERESFFAEISDEFDTEKLCSPVYIFDEQQKDQNGTIPSTNWSTSPFSDEELCHAKEMIQNKILNATPTSELLQDSRATNHMQQIHNKNTLSSGSQNTNFQNEKASINEQHCVSTHFAKDIPKSLGMGIQKNQICENNMPPSNLQTFCVIDNDEIWINTDFEESEEPTAAKNSNIYNNADLLNDFYEPMEEPGIYLAKDTTQNSRKKVSCNAPSSEHRYGQVLAWLSDESVTTNTEKQCKKHDLMSPKNANERQERCFQDDCNDTLHQKFNISTTETNAFCNKVSSDLSTMTSCFFTSDRSENRSEVADVGSNLFAGIF